MDSFDQGQEKNDLHYRRMKNRERQRRYRERKRLQEELKKTRSVTVNEHEPPPRLLSPPPVPSTTVTNRVFGESQSVNHRVLCRRNWKKDARNAANLARQQTVSDHAQQQPAHENEGSKSYSGSKVGEPNSIPCSSDNLILVRDEKPKIKRGGRHWKAEARNKRREICM